MHEPYKSDDSYLMQQVDILISKNHAGATNISYTMYNHYVYRVMIATVLNTNTH